MRIKFHSYKIKSTKIRTKDSNKYLTVPFLRIISESFSNILVRSVFCAFISKQIELTDQLKYCPSLLTTFAHFLSSNFRIPSWKNDSSLEAI